MTNNMLLWACVRVTIITDWLRKMFIKLLVVAAAGNPVLAFAGSDIADMGSSAAEGAKSGMKSALTIAQFIGVLFVIGGIIAAKNKKNNPQITVGAIIGSILFGVLLLAIPEAIKRSQAQVGLTPVSVG